MNLEKYISGLLFEHDCVIIPGLGGFIANYSPAGINPVTHTFTPPSRQLAFNARLSTNDGILAGKIASAEQVSFEEAVRMIEREVARIKDILNRSGNFRLEGIGHLNCNHGNRLDFIPDNRINYLDDAFGLASFTSQPVIRKPVTPLAVPTMRKLPPALRWAAVILPIAAISIWSALNTGGLTQFRKNYASLLPSKPEMTISAPAETAATEIKNADTYVVQPEEVAPEPEAIPEPATINAQPDIYFVITGAFSIEENAEKLVNELIAEGYNATIAGQNNQGLYRVSIAGFSDKDLALSKMEEFRSGGYPNAWLLTRR